MMWWSRLHIVDLHLCAVEYEEKTSRSGQTITKESAAYLETAQYGNSIASIANRSMNTKGRGRLSLDPDADIPALGLIRQTYPDKYRVSVIRTVAGLTYTLLFSKTLRCVWYSTVAKLSYSH